MCGLYVCDFWSLLLQITTLFSYFSACKTFKELIVLWKSYPPLRIIRNLLHRSCFDSICLPFHKVQPQLSPMRKGHQLQPRGYAHLTFQLLRNIQYPGNLYHVRTAFASNLVTSTIERIARKLICDYEGFLNLGWGGWLCFFIHNIGPVTDIISQFKI